MPEEGLNQIHSEAPRGGIVRAEREQEALFERDDREKRHLHRAFLAAIWVAMALLGAMAITLVCNWIPDSCHWLNNSEVENLRLVLGSALGGGVLTKVIEKKLKGK